MANSELGGAIISPRRRPLCFGFAAVVVSLGFAAITGHMWEDYLITFRASLNLATGNGLVFQPGEHVHSFTSPLGTLLPALFALGGGENVAVHALWGLRIVSALALGGALWIAMREFLQDGLVPIAMTAAGMAWVLDPKTVDFSMNGMETALVVFFVTYTWHAFSSGARLWPCALAFAGLQWTRPDGCVYFGAIAGAWMLFGGSRAGLAWRGRLILLLRTIAVGWVLYLPWFVWAWSYYGSPVPHTILAKMNPRTVGEVATLLLLYPWRLLFGAVPLHDVFMPAYYFFGGWPDPLLWVSRLVVMGAALSWVWSGIAPAGRLASAAFFIGGFYVSYIPPSAWYYPGWQALALIAWGYLLHALWHVHPRVKWALRLPQSVTRIAAASLVIVQGALLVCVTWQMRSQQSLIENQHRTEIGRWLRQSASANDSVFLECLGYIGYYSDLKMLDYPGLAAPEVVAARRAGHQRWADIIEVLHPNWLVLRPDDEAKVFANVPALREQYRLVRTFNHRAAIDAVPLLPGRGYLNFDAVFKIYRRTSTESRQR